MRTVACIIRAGMVCVMVALMVCVRVAYAVDSYAPVPGVIHYQAHMTTIDGMRYDGTVPVRVFIYDSPVLGAHGYANDAHVLYAEDHGSVRVERGILRIGIGEGTALGRFAGASLPMESLATAAELYAEIYLDGEYLAPRQRLSFHNAALRAQYTRQAQDVYGVLRLNANNLPDMAATKANVDRLAPSRIPLLTRDWLRNEPVSLSRLPVGIPLSWISGGTLARSVLPEFSATTISTGTFQTSQLPATLMPRSSIKAEMGILSHGASIQPIAGYELGDCAWIVAYINGSNTLDVCDGINKFYIYADRDTQSVMCQLNRGGTTVACPVQYLMFCKDNDVAF